MKREFKLKHFPILTKIESIVENKNSPRVESEQLEKEKG
jgi:hypothetical protein